MHQSNFRNKELGELSREIEGFARKLERQRPNRPVAQNRRPMAGASSDNSGGSVSDLLGRINALSSTISDIKKRQPSGTQANRIVQPSQASESNGIGRRRISTGSRNSSHYASDSQEPVVDGPAGHASFAPYNGAGSPADITPALSRLENLIAQQAEMLSRDLASSRDLSSVAYAVDTLNERLAVASQSEVSQDDIARLESGISLLSDEIKAQNSRTFSIEHAQGLNLAIERLTERLSTLDTLAIPSPDVEELTRGVHGLISVIQDQLPERLAEASNSPQQFELLGAQINILNDQIESLHEQAVKSQDLANVSTRLLGLEDVIAQQMDEVNGLSILANQFEDLNQSVSSLSDASVSREELRTLFTAVEQFEHKLGQLSQDVASATDVQVISQSLDTLSGKVDHLKSEEVIEERLGALRSYLDEAFEASTQRQAETAQSTVDKIDQLLQEGHFDAPVNRIVELVDALQTNIASLPQTDQFEKITLELSQLREQFISPETTERLETFTSSFEDLSKKLDTIQNGPLMDILDARFKKLEDVVSLEKLDEKYAAIASKLDSLEKNVKTSQPRSLSASLKKALNDLETAAASFPTTDIKDALSELDTKINSLDSKVAEGLITSARQNSTADLPIDEIVERIVAKTEQTLANTPAKADLEALSTSLSDLSNQIAKTVTKDSTGKQDLVLSAIKDLSTQLNDLMNVAEDTAQNIAREAVELINSQNPGTIRASHDPMPRQDLIMSDELSLEPAERFAKAQSDVQTDEASAASPEPSPELNAEAIFKNKSDDEYGLASIESRIASFMSDKAEPVAATEDENDSTDRENSRESLRDTVSKSAEKPRRHDPAHDEKHAALMARLREVSQRSNRTPRPANPLEQYAKPLGPDEEYIESIDIHEPKYGGPIVSETLGFGHLESDQADDLTAASRAEFIAAARRAAQTAAYEEQRKADAEQEQQKNPGAFSILKKFASPSPVEQAATAPKSKNEGRDLKDRIAEKLGYADPKNKQQEDFAADPATIEPKLERSDLPGEGIEPTLMPADEREAKKPEAGFSIDENALRQEPGFQRAAPASSDLGKPIGMDLLDSPDETSSEFNQTIDRPIGSDKSAKKDRKSKPKRRFPFGFRKIVAVLAAGITGLAGWQITNSLLDSEDFVGANVALLSPAETGESTHSSSFEIAERNARPVTATENTHALDSQIASQNPAPEVTSQTDGAKIDRINPQDIAEIIAASPAADTNRISTSNTVIQATTPQAPTSSELMTSSINPNEEQRAEFALDVPSEITSSKLRSAIERNDPYAYFEVGTRYLEGRLVERNLEQAALWYERAADKGLAPAQYRIGNFYERGNGVPRDYTKARDWYVKAADAGNVKAMHNLAVLYLNGYLGAPDYPSAIKWFKDAAEHGVRDSQYNLGVLYFEGLGVNKSPTESYRWFAIAAKLGDTEAGRQRDTVASMLDQTSLEAAQRSVDAWMKKPAIDIANRIIAPRGGWDDAPAKDARLVNTGQSTIAQTQALLTALGFDVGPTDGVLGPRTRDAIRTFERNNGLEVTGEISAGLISRLTAAVI